MQWVGVVLALEYLQTNDQKSKTLFLVIQRKSFIAKRYIYRIETLMEKPKKSM
jgi:hypothetical protein